MTKCIAMAYAHHENWGEQWSNTIGLKNEFVRQGYKVRVCNLYEHDGKFREDGQPRRYSPESLINLKYQYDNGFRPEFILICDYGMFNHPIMDQRNYPEVPVIFELADTPQSRNAHMFKVKKATFAFTPDYLSALQFTDLGMYTFWTVHWTDINLFTADDKPEETDVITTCGSRRFKDIPGFTNELERRLEDRFWNKRFFYGKDHSDFLNKGRIVFQCSQFGEITRRIFEGASCGKLVLTDRLHQVTNIDEIFEEDKEIVYYGSIEEAISKIDFYSRNSKERRRIADAGYWKVLEQHTTGDRVRLIQRAVNTLKFFGGEVSCERALSILKKQYPDLKGFGRD